MILRYISYFDHFWWTAHKWTAETLRQTLLLPTPRPLEGQIVSTNRMQMHSKHLCTFNFAVTVWRGTM